MSLSRTDTLLLNKIREFAALSRILYIVLQVVANITIPDHDAGVFNPPQRPGLQFTMADKLVQTVFGGLRRWDAVYFIHNAEHGYIYENTLAFFPLYSLLTYFISNTLLYPFQFVMSYSSVLLLSGVLLNQLLFIQTAKSLYLLGLKMTGNDTIAYKAALLFCFNPATIFMLAPYSEVVYLYLTVNGLHYLYNKCPVKACLLFSLSGLARSNGVINVGFIWYETLQDLVTKLKSFQQGMFLDLTTFFTCLYILFFYTFLPALISTLLVLAPFVLYQIYCYTLYCGSSQMFSVPQYLREYGEQEGYLVYGSGQGSWCNGTLPLAYSYIQKHHWNNGLFSYYELKQIPNFVLALPVTILSLYTLSSYYRHNTYTVWTLGLDTVGINKKGTEPREPGIKKTYRLSGPHLVPHVIHLLILTVFGWLFMHIQVLTRFLFSSSPVLFWCSAHLVSKATPTRTSSNPYSISSQRQELNIERQENVGRYLRNLITTGKPHAFFSKLLLTYFLGYSIIGTILFSNFLPWT